MKVRVKVEVNGLERESLVEPRVTLASFLRDDLGLTGTHIGCETTNCGACAVLLDGRPVKSCAVLAVQADGRKVPRHLGYNLAAISFSAGEIASEIRKQIPGFRVTYSPDQRQNIADSWPMSISDTEARRDWGWSHEYDLAKMTSDMLLKLGPRLESGQKDV
jgi:hypothetical protein